MAKKGDNTLQAAEEYGRQGLFDAAAQAYHEAAAHYKDIQDFTRQAEAFTLLGEMFKNSLSDYERALESFQQSLRVRQIYGLKRLSNEYYNVAEQQNYLGRLEEAKDNLERARHAAKREGDHQTLSKALILLGDILVEEGYLDEAENNLRICLEMVTEQGDDPLIANVQSSIGLLLGCRNRWEQAMNACQSALEHAERTTDPETTGKALLRFGQVLWMSGDHVAARKYLDRAQQIAVETHLRILQQTATDWLSRCGTETKR
jgi:tetratricopeptide (TPR) repeat protein